MSATQQPDAATAIVTGAAGGIGAALCLELEARGIRAVGLDVAWPAASGPRPAEQLTADVTRPQELRDVLAPVTPRPRFAFVNAGLVEPNQRLLDLQEADARRIIDVNVLGAIFTVAELARVMQDAGGSILLVGSVQGLIGRATYAVYGASKAAVAGLARHAAAELAPLGIRVNAIAPGGVLTPRQVASFDDPASGRDADAEFGKVLLGRFAGVDEMARAMVDICTRFDFATGSTFVVDGGESVP